LIETINVPERVLQLLVGGSNAKAPYSAARRTLFR